MEQAQMCEIALHDEILSNARLPEHDLLAMLIITAINDIIFVKPPNKYYYTYERTWYFEAVQWMSGSETNGFSFEYCCDHLDLDPDVIRAKVNEMREQPKPYSFLRQARYTGRPRGFEQVSN